jgi:hypothetical protein
MIFALVKCRDHIHPYISFVNAFIRTIVLTHDRAKEINIIADIPVSVVTTIGRISKCCFPPTRHIRRTRVGPGSTRRWLYPICR